MSFIIRWTLALPLLLLASLALSAQTDRIFNNLTPTEGQAFITPLTAGKIYRQIFTTPRSTLSKLGLYLVPLRQSLVPTNLNVTIGRGGKQIGQTAVSLTTIPPGGPTYAVFTPPLVTQRGENLTLTLTIPIEATDSVGVQRRQVDSSFVAADIPFSIDNKVQSEPMALAAYAVYRPAFMVAIGWGLLIAALLTISYPRWWTRRFYTYGASVLIVSLVPRLLGLSTSWLLVAATVLAAMGIIVLLREEGFSDMAAVAGANLWAFTTWWPLQSIAGRDYHLLVAALPFLGLAKRNRRYVWVILAWVIVVLIFGHQSTGAIPGAATANLKDIFVDPYQVAVAEKTSLLNVTWDHFGSYIGLINVGLFLIGLIWQGKKNWPWVLGGLICLAVATWPPLVHLLSNSVVPPQYFIIGTTLVATYFTAWGVQGLLTYLKPGRLTAALTWAVVLLAFLDLYYVWATVIEFTSL